jgi:predicted nucleic acid-binding protein
MRLACLDTTALSDAIQNRAEIGEKLRELEDAGCAFATTAINVFEVEVAIERDASPGGQAEKRERLEKLLATVPVIPFDREAAGEAARASARLYARGRPAAVLDMLVAATGKAAGCDGILTRNVAQFKRMGLLEVATY